MGVVDDRQSRYLRAKAIASTADELPPAQRERHVEDACGGDAALLMEVRWLQQALAADTDLPMLAWTQADPPNRTGERVAAAAASDYRIVRKLGQGGMGVVYLAERQHEGFVQQAALKLLLRAPTGPSKAQERFVRERALLARLDHPGIARLLDGGLLSDGQPFLALEYVEGEHIDRWCRQHAPDLRTRIELFLEVCAAVAYAHRHLVIHRDIKPANILVTADGHAKLLDFGVARLLETQDGTSMEPTEVGQQALTIAYASPEQITQQSLSVATDIYSLGVVLYQLVCGSHPFGHFASSYDVSRAIVGGEVLPPSRQAGSGERRTGVPADLDAIVLKAMRLAVDERYATVDALADDLQRFLQRRPVRARRGQWSYRARRFVQRNRWPMAAGTAIAASIVAGLFASLAALSQAREQQHLAQQRQLQLERITAFQQDMLESVDIEAMGHALSSAHRAAVVQAIASAPDGTAAAIGRVERAFAQVPDSDIARDVLDRYVVSHALSRLQQDFAGAPLLAADLRQSMARVLIAIGRYPSAIAELRRVLDARRKALPPGDRRITSTMTDLGEALTQQGALEPAARVFGAAMQVRGLLPEADPLRLRIESGQARTLAAQGQLSAALARQQSLEAAWSALLPATDTDLLELRRDAVTTLTKLGRRKEAREQMEALLPLYRDRFGPQAPGTLAATLSLAELTNTFNEYETSLRMAQHVAEQRERQLGGDHPETLRAMALEGANRVRLAQDEPAFRQAEAFMQQLLARQARVLGRDHPQTLASMTEMVRVLGKQDVPSKTEQAIALQRQILAARRRTLGALHPDSIYSLGGLASLLCTAGQYQQARQAAYEALALYAKALPANHRIISATWDVVGRAERGARHWQAARDAHATALAMRANASGALDAHTIESASRLYVVLLQLHDQAALDDIRSRYLEPVIALDPAGLNASMRDIRESAVLALKGIHK
ncbi:protein kinase [Lysobacter cavernae]|uniref:Protein kinase n=1 Tax=Lysobacter cavernae TaxID=1685901 RepID=A0ABV7RKC3_9GAMM